MDKQTDRHTDIQTGKTHIGRQLDRQKDRKTGQTHGQTGQTHGQTGETHGQTGQTHTTYISRSCITHCVARTIYINFGNRKPVHFLASCLQALPIFGAIAFHCCHNVMSLVSPSLPQFHVTPYTG